MLTYLLHKKAFSLKLGSDIPQGPIRTGLSPSPARFDFTTLCTVFVKVFLIIFYDEFP